MNLYNRYQKLFIVELETIVIKGKYKNMNLCEYLLLKQKNWKTLPDAIKERKRGD